MRYHCDNYLVAFENRAAVSVLTKKLAKIRLQSDEAIRSNYLIEQAGLQNPANRKKIFRRVRWHFVPINHNPTDE